MSSDEQELSRVIDGLEQTFNAAATGMDTHHRDRDKLNDIATTLLAELDAPAVQAAIANNTSDCGQFALETVMLAMPRCTVGVPTPEVHLNGVLNVAKRILDLDVHKKIRVETYANTPHTTLLSIAVGIADDAELCQSLLDRGADATAVNLREQNAVLTAARWGHKNALEVLLNAFGTEHSVWEHANRNGDNVVTIAARFGHTAVLEFLLKGFGTEHKIWAHAVRCRDNVVTLAARQGQVHILELLLEAFGDQHRIWAHTDGNCHNVVSVAADEGRTEVLEFLLDAFATENVVWTQTGRGNRNVVMIAAKNGDAAVLKLLLKKFGKRHTFWGVHDNGQDIVKAAALKGRIAVLKFSLSVFDRDNTEVWLRKNRRHKTAADLTPSAACQKLVRRIQLR